MSVILQPWQLFVAVLAEWVREEQEKRIEFLKLEIGVLLEQSGDKRVLLPIGASPCAQTRAEFLRGTRVPCLILTNDAAAKLDRKNRPGFVA